MCRATAAGSASTPAPPALAPPIHGSLASLPPDAPPAAWVRSLYPPDVFPGGAYAALPYGRTRFWLVGPEEGTKVRTVPELELGL